MKSGYLQVKDRTKHTLPYRFKSINPIKTIGLFIRHILNNALKHCKTSNYTVLYITGMLIGFTGTNTKCLHHEK